MIRRLRSESGMTVTELMVAGLLMLIVLAIAVVWFQAINRVDVFQEDDFDALDQLRLARSDITKELRFADGVLPNPAVNTIEIWIDLDDSGGTGPDQPGEQITWQITGDQLIRYEDGDPSNAVVKAANIVEASSSITRLDATVTIDLVADTEAGEGPDVRQVSTQVTLRNYESP